MLCRSAAGLSGVGSAARRQVELLVLDDVEKEYLLVHARLQLLQKDPDPSRLTGGCHEATPTEG